MRKSEVRLTNALARTLPAPERDNRVTYDGGEDSIRGFGLRVTSTGTKSFVLNYTVGGARAPLHDRLVSGVVGCIGPRGSEAAAPANR